MLSFFDSVKHLDEAQKKMLVSHGVKLSVFTALEIAPWSIAYSQIQNWEEIYQWLENKRFDINRVDDIEGKTLLEYVEDDGIKSALRERGALTALEKAFKGAEKNNWDIVFDCLGKHAVEPHSVNPLGLPTLLDYAVQHNNLQAIARLLYYPLPPNIAYQRFAFLAAKAKAWEKVYYMLDQNLIEISAHDEFGKTLFDYGLDKKNEDTLFTELQSTISQLTALKTKDEKSQEPISPCITPGLESQSLDLKELDGMQSISPFENVPIERSEPQHFIKPGTN